MMNDKISKLIEELKTEIKNINNFDEKVNVINEINSSISEVSPFNGEPISNIQWIKLDNVQSNEYNPNRVFTTEMKLLYESIKLDGYTQPVVTYKLDNDMTEIVDGFHRNRVAREHKDINKRLNGYLPTTKIDKPLDERMGSTIRHNRARGTHQIKDMSEIVLELTKQNWKDEDICKKLGMELDEVIRLKQITGLKEAFANHTFSKSWEEYEKRRENYYDEEN